MPASGHSCLAGIIGWPVGHSLSPRLHGFWLRRHGIDGAYIKLPVMAADLAQVFGALPRCGFRGWNVTVPHKAAALALVDEPDPAAATLGAVNTVLVLPDGRLRGLNTDAPGFLASLDADAPGWRRNPGPAVVLGAGGAARAVTASLLTAGAGGLRLLNRTRERAEMLAERLRRRADAPIEVVAWEERDAALDDAALLVNTTSLGMVGQPPLELALDALPLTAPVMDLVYVPLETGLLAAARTRGHTVVDGLGMLLHQAVPGFRWWGGIEPVVDAATRDFVLEGLAAR